MFSQKKTKNGQSCVPTQPTVSRSEAVEEPPAFQNDSFSQVFEMLVNTRAASSVLEGTTVPKCLQFCEGLRVGWLRTSQSDCGRMGMCASGLVLFIHSVLFVQLALNRAKNSILGVCLCDLVHLY